MGDVLENEYAGPRKDLYHLNQQLQRQLEALTESLQLTWEDLVDRSGIVTKIREVFTPSHPGSFLLVFEDGELYGQKSDCVLFLGLCRAHTLPNLFFPFCFCCRYFLGALIKSFSSIQFFFSYITAWVSLFLLLRILTWIVSKGIGSDVWA